jgi:hypothetical protein
MHIFGQMGGRATKLVALSILVALTAIIIATAYLTAIYERIESNMVNLIVLNEAYHHKSNNRNVDKAVALSFESSLFVLRNSRSKPLGGIVYWFVQVNNATRRELFENLKNKYL